MTHQREPSAFLSIGFALIVLLLILVAWCERRSVERVQLLEVRGE